MSATNVKTKRSHVYEEERLAGGYGPRAAKQPDEMNLRRLVLSCLLWEDIAYAEGSTVAKQIGELIPKVDPAKVANLAVEARFEQKLRHVPLLICREMARHESHRGFVANTLGKVIHRPDELSEFLSIYWKDNLKDGKKVKTLSAQVKKGLAKAFAKFEAYALAKWNRDSKEVKLRDVLFLSHAKPKGGDQDALWKQLIADTLPTPDTWEVGLSSAKTNEEKCAVWERLLEDDKLGALAFMKNLRNMQEHGVSKRTIISGLGKVKPTMLLPIDFIRAVKHAPDFTREIEDVMFRCAAEFPKLPGWSIFVVDVSGSMQQAMSAKTDFHRLDAAAAMTVLAQEMCEHVTIYATAGSDSARTHSTRKITPVRGFALADRVRESAGELGGGGIFTRQCLEYIADQEKDVPDRIIVFSDSADCDLPERRKPKPFGKRNYIVDVSSHKHGINYDGVWTAEISGWSEAFLKFVAAMESPTNN